VSDLAKPRPSILQSGLDIVKRDAELLRKQGKTVAIVTVANPSGIKVGGTLAWDMKGGSLELSASLEKLRHTKSHDWEVAVVWSR
jgi:hypothetical protein